MGALERIVAAVTAHRPPKIGGYKPCPTHDWIRVRLREKLLELKPDEAISGMALGGDQLFVEVCIELGIPFIAAVPFEGQEFGWPWYSQQRYLTLLNKAARVHIVDPVPPKDQWEATQKLHNRNHWMADNSDVLIAVWDGSKGGTAECVKYAQKVGRTVHRISGWTV